jgi:hypothetical protein
MSFQSAMRQFNKLFATAVLILVFVLFVLLIFGLFNVGGMLG